MDADFIQRAAMAVNSATRANLRAADIRNAVQFDEVVTRQMQAFRGALSSKMVASRAALQSLQCVELSELPEGEKSEIHSPSVIRLCLCRREWLTSLFLSQLVQFATMSTVTKAPKG